MPKGKSIIPKQAQLPAAVILALLFGVLLWWRFGPRAGSGTAPAEAASVSVEAPKANVEVLRQLIAELKAESWEAPALPGSLPALEGDPFQRASMPGGRGMEIAVESPQEAVDVEPPAEEPSGPTREEILATLRLTATCVMGNWAMAVINGRYMEVGDTIAGFVVREVKNREVVLDDGVGPLSLYIACPVWAFEYPASSAAVSEHGGSQS